MNLHVLVSHSVLPEPPKEDATEEEKKNYVEILKKYVPIKEKHDIFKELEGYVQIFNKGY